VSQYLGALITVIVTRHPSPFGNRPTAVNNVFGAAGPPNHNLMAIDQDLVANSRGVSVVVAKEPAQPLATLRGADTTSFPDIRKYRTPDLRAVGLKGQ
jgi:hypothetical protein